MNDTFNQKSVDNLFEQARSNQPPLYDATFTNAVMNRLATRTARSSQSVQLNNSRRFSWVDALGLSLGVVACFSVAEPTQLFSQLVTLAGAVLPDKLVLSPLTIAGASVTMAALCFSAWAALEGDLSS